MYTVEFKIRYVGDMRKWEDIPPMPQEFISKSHADKRAIALSGLPDVVEVRSNAPGSLQGRYWAGNRASRDRHMKGVFSHHNPALVELTRRRYFSFQVRQVGNSHEWPDVVVTYTLRCTYARAMELAFTTVSLESVDEVRIVSDDGCIEQIVR